MHPDIKYLLFTVVIFVFFTVGFVWYYKKYVSIYSEFPKFNFMSYILKSVLLSKVPQHIPINAFFFQYLIKECSRFQSEGLCLFWIFQPYLAIYGEEALKVFSNEQNTINKPYNFDLFKEFLMTSLLTSGGALWKKRRKMLSPIFSSPNLRDTTCLINKNAKKLVENLLKHNASASADIKKFLKDCTIRNIFEFLSGLDSYSAQNNSEMEEVVQCVNQASEMIIIRIFKPWLHPRILLPFFTTGRLFLKTARKSLQLAEKLLRKVQQSARDNKRKIKTETDDYYLNLRRTFAQVITEHHIKDPSFSSKDMQGEFTGLLSAGYDTVSYALMWSLFLLGHHPDVQDQVHEEIESVIGHDDEVSYKDLQNLKYLECVIKESLRLYPPVPLYGRRTVTDIKCGKYTVPKGTNIVFLPYLAHRDPTVFPDPEKCDPERFLEGNSDKKISIYPFAEGVRSCIGKKFAMIEMKIILSHILKNFNVMSLDRPEDIELCWEVVLTTVKPLRVDLIPRQQVSVQE